MSTPPLFTRAEADRILRRASEIEGAGEEKLLSVAEVRSIGVEVGFSSQTLERAIADVQAASLSPRRGPLQKSGLFIVHLSTVREIPVQMDADQLMRVVRLFHPYRVGAPQVKLDDVEISWRERRGLRFAISSADGCTEIRVYVAGILLRRGRWREWVRTAADRLEALATLVATQRLVGRSAPESLPAPPRPASPSP